MVCRGLTFRTGITFALFQHYLIKLASILKKICRDTSPYAINSTGRISAFKSGNKLQLSVDYLSAYPLLPLHYLCSLLFYNSRLGTCCKQKVDGLLAGTLLFFLNCSIVKFGCNCHPCGIKCIGTTD